MLKRFRWGVRVTSLVVGLAVTCAMAFFIGSFMADGTHEGTVGSGGTGTGEVPIEVNFPSAELTPTHPVALTAVVNNTTSATRTFKQVTFTVTVPAPANGCEASWFSVVPVGSENPVNNWMEVLEGKVPMNLAYPVGKTPLGEGNPEHVTWSLKLKDTGTNQSACEGKTIKVKAHATE